MSLTEQEIQAVRDTISMELYPCESQERADAIAEIVERAIRDAQQAADAQVQRAAVRVMTKALDDLVSACMNGDGTLRPPDRASLMRARGLLPAYCKNTLQPKAQPATADKH